MPTILERVTKVTAAKLSAKEEAVTPTANFTDDLGADSLDQVELIMGLEEEFTTPGKPIKIPDEDAAKIKTVQDAVDYIKGKGITDADSKPQAAAPPVAPAPAAKAAPVVAPKAATPKAAAPKSPKGK
jgi:acyl carrier protein